MKYDTFKMDSSRLSFYPCDKPEEVPSDWLVGSINPFKGWNAIAIASTHNPSSSRKRGNPMKIKIVFLRIPENFVSFNWMIASKLRLLINTTDHKNIHIKRITDIVNDEGLYRIYAKGAPLLNVRGNDVRLYKAVTSKLSATNIDIDEYSSELIKALANINWDIAAPMFKS